MQETRGSWVRKDEIREQGVDIKGSGDRDPRRNRMLLSFGLRRWARVGHAACPYRLSNPKGLGVPPHRPMSSGNAGWHQYPFCLPLDMLLEPQDRSIDIELPTKFFVNLDEIKATECIGNPNRGVICKVVAPLAEIGRIPNLRVLSIPWGESLDPGHHNLPPPLPQPPL
ncbi:hypothetical protein CRG98_041205 [Punica granatum]|uniref:Uncharacterized protein n=1 Tax=Punica granatum TaxID=22663 RepID=A0A2I0I355_PUNGR|nr:hypothetical protein CRG98_041205 [Punica granatum]